MGSKLVDAARLGRSSGAVLKLELAHLKSKSPGNVVFILEGKDDYGPYECWIDRIGAEYTYSLLCGKGKSQLLDLRRRLSDDRTTLKQGVYFIVDADFDGLRGGEEGQDIYVTDTYSVENLLVSEEIVRSILTDEFQLSGAPKVVDGLVEQYSKTCDMFGKISRYVNLRIYCRAKLQLSAGNLNNSINKFANIRFDTVTENCTDIDVRCLVPLSREPSREEVRSLEEQFDMFIPVNHYRGKYWLVFLKTWLDIIAAMRKHGKCGLPQLSSLAFSSSNLSFRSLASRRAPPQSLRRFVESACL